MEKEWVEYLEEAPDSNENAVYFLLVVDFLLGFSISCVDCYGYQTGNPKELE